MRARTPARLAFERASCPERTSRGFEDSASASPLRCAFQKIGAAISGNSDSAFVIRSVDHTSRGFEDSASASPLHCAFQKLGAVLPGNSISASFIRSVDHCGPWSAVRLMIAALLAMALAPVAPAPAGFTALDWSVVVVYFLCVLALGIWFARRQKNAGDYFLAGRRIPMWAASISILATTLSAVTFIGAPEEAFAGNLTYISANLGVVIAAVVVAVFFIPVFYRHNVTTVYELLEIRMGTNAKLGASAMFMLGRIFASGSRLFAAAIPLSLIVFGNIEPQHMVQSILMIAFVAALYTTFGGIAAVIWTDTAQVIILVGAALVAAFLLVQRIPESPLEIGRILAESQAADGSSKLALFDFRTDLSLPYTVWSAIFGFSLLNMAWYGTDQDLVQRMLTCRSAFRASMSLILSAFIAIGVVAIFLALGLLLYVYYARPDIMGAAAPALDIADTRRVFLVFILDEMPVGLRGLMIAGLFAAAMSSLDSGLNAMASTAVSDWYRPLRRGKSDRHYLRVSRLAVALWAMALASFACICVWWQQASGEGLLQFALGVMVFAYAGLLGVFLTAIFTKRGSSVSVCIALVAGFVTVLFLQNAPALGINLNLSLGWRMLVGTVVSFSICASGRPKRRDSTVQAE
ncbi:MAG: sodium:solute symporter [Phycisphaeraceae bacterium]|nr:MAG: sodium:solute symporter [Phycisphaeraceae bacterium]